MTLPPYIRVQGDLVFLSVKVQPRASRNEIGPALAEELKIKVTAPPVDSAANDAVVELIAESLDCARGAVQIVRGATARHKTIAVRGVPLERILQVLKR